VLEGVFLLELEQDPYVSWDLGWKEIEMGKLVRIKRGQALTEYAVLIPCAILLAILAAWALGPTIGDFYRHVAAILSGQKPCATFSGAEDNSLCDHRDACIKADYEGEQSGSITYDGELSIEAAVIKAGQTYEVRRDNPYVYEYVTDDGCYLVKFKTNTVTWQRIGSGPNCQDVSHIDAWSVPLCDPEQ
jgi:hypothetical protein